MTTETIDGADYTVERLSARKALVTALRIAKHVGVLAPALKGLDPKKQASDDNALAAMGQLFSAIDPEEVTQLIEDLCKQAIKGSQPITSLDKDFGPDGLITAVKVAWLVIRVNYAGALAKMGNFVGQAAPK